MEDSVHSHQPSPGWPPAFAVIVTHLQPLTECLVPQSASQGAVPGPRPSYSGCFLLFFPRTLLDTHILGRDNLPLGLVPYSLFFSLSRYPVSSKNQAVIPLLCTLQPSHDTQTQTWTPSHSLASLLGLVLTPAHTTLLPYCHPFFSSSSLDSSLPPSLHMFCFAMENMVFPLTHRFVLGRLSGVSYSRPWSVSCHQPCCYSLPLHLSLAFVTIGVCFCIYSLICHLISKYFGERRMSYSPLCLVGSV